MKRVALFALIITTIYSCGSNDRGELTGVNSKRKWFAEKPLGMTLVPGGSFTMGKQEEDVIGNLSAPTRTVTVRPFYMDETEITNSEYKQFVFAVKDSIVRTKLAYKAEEVTLLSNAPAGTPSTGGIQDFAFPSLDSDNATPYDKYMLENYYGFGGALDSLRPLNKDVDIIWDKNNYPDEHYVEVMDSLYLKKDETYDGNRTFNKKFLNYKYFWFDKDAAIKKGGNAKDFLRSEIVNVYPDTAVWVKDFNYSYNDPMHQDYFYHDAYADYPVVGVDWYQAQAFCNWRTKNKNDYLKASKNKVIAPDYRLPTEAEWEYAARGGLDFAKYPWGGPSTTSDRGCFLANFKPVRGDYAVDGALYTVEAKSFNTNDYGLYNMAGNVSEWTNSSYDPSSYYIGSTMNPNVEDKNNNRKIIRGGSWKDVAYFLEVSSRDYEYGDTARSYIGFRTVQNYLGKIYDNN
ncbi:MAG: gliding motility lipoprotein GldK [Polaribacter sp.]|nr:gliding motility lipoprotein GldK [Polaribacter sp.]MDG1811402.1 gliding motility lipoprotein GldK [Polaribacter sp.]MDG1994372.1 gliding motility lipoprotein GldK [Polaribacter sp.]